MVFSIWGVQETEQCPDRFSFSFLLLVAHRAAMRGDVLRSEHPIRPSEIQQLWLRPGWGLEWSHRGLWFYLSRLVLAKLWLIKFGCCGCVQHWLSITAGCTFCYLCKMRDYTSCYLCKMIVYAPYYSCKIKESIHSVQVQYMHSATFVRCEFMHHIISLR